MVSSGDGSSGDGELTRWRVEKIVNLRDVVFSKWEVHEIVSSVEL